jgi:hypothetical protein
MQLRKAEIETTSCKAGAHLISSSARLQKKKEGGGERQKKPVDKFECLPSRLCGL